MKKELNRKGFTLAELLIVVAIIAVLVAVAIPVFNSQLEKSRESTDAANLRSAYAVATIATMDADLDEPGVAAGPVTMKQTVTGWQHVNETIGGVALSDGAVISTVEKGDNIYVNVSSAGTAEFSKTMGKTGYKVVNPITGED